MSLAQDGAAIRLRMTRGTYTLIDYPARSSIEIHCPKCGREGRYRRESLLDRYGPTQALPDVLVALCPPTVPGAALGSSPTPAKQSIALCRPASHVFARRSTRVK